ncbi:unnamed protein product [Cuscuta campestris]|uniref:Uncharacterized protein n=1 Tax=Cuscuta campestris TaxID=132261 RepID=A0A484KD62_9ASTE|nr:unnamed protein product [Cuscuta campestris]
MAWILGLFWVGSLWFTTRSIDLPRFGVSLANPVDAFELWSLCLDLWIVCLCYHSHNTCWIPLGCCLRTYTYLQFGTA